MARLAVASTGHKCPA